MSSWYVFAALGLYPEIPGVAGFALGSPLFPTITVHLGNGHTLSIQSSGASAAAYYVQSLKVNGQSINRHVSHLLEQRFDERQKLVKNRT